MSTLPPADRRDERQRAKLGELLDRLEREYPPTWLDAFTRPDDDS